MQTPLDISIINFQKCFLQHATSYEKNAQIFIDEITPDFIQDLWGARAKLKHPYLWCARLGYTVAEMSILYDSLEAFKKCVDDTSKEPLAPVIQYMFSIWGDWYYKDAESMELYLKEPNNEMVAFQIAEQCKGYQFKSVKMLLQNPRVICCALYRAVEGLGILGANPIMLSDAILATNDVPIFEVLKLFFCLITLEDTNARTYLHSILIEPNTSLQEIIHHCLKKEECSILNGLLALFDLSQHDVSIQNSIDSIVSRIIMNHATSSMPQLLDAESIYVIKNHILNSKKFLIDLRQENNPNAREEINTILKGLNEALIISDPSAQKAFLFFANRKGLGSLYDLSKNVCTSLLTHSEPFKNAFSINK